MLAVRRLRASPLPLQGSALVAVFAAGWAAAFSLTGPPAAYLAVPLVLAGVLLLGRRPLAGASLVLAAALVTLAVGAEYGNVDLVAAIAVTLFSIGRTLPGVLVGGALTVAFALASAARDGLTPGDLAVTTTVFGAMWLFGVVVGHRATQARAAVAEMERVAGEDPTRMAAERVAAERTRLAGDALVALRTAVVDMRWTAAAAVDDPGTVLIEDIQARGRAAVQELRALLGLLRDEEVPAPAPTDESPDRPRGWVDLAIAAALALAVLAWALPDGTWRDEPGALAAQGATVVAILLRRRSVTLALVIAILGTSIALTTPPTDPEALLPVAVGYGLLCWTVTTRHPTRAAMTALTLLVGAGAALATHFGPAGVGFVCVAFGTPFLSGRAWGERLRLEREARRRVQALHRYREAQAAAVLRAERLHLARELHDVTSHAVGVMVTQAGAARALLGRDRPRAVEALGRVRDAGDQALDEISHLFGVLDQPGHRLDVRPAGERAEQAQPAGAAEQSLRDALLELVARTRLAGVDVELDLGALPTEPGAAVATYRLVQEGLTNVLRHARGARVVVETAGDTEGHLVRVRDDGAPARQSGPVTTKGAGFGLTGLAERLRSCGGRLVIDRPDDGGFVLEGHFPAGPAEIRPTPR